MRYLTNRWRRPGPTQSDDSFELELARGRATVNRDVDSRTGWSGGRLAVDHGVGTGPTRARVVIAARREG